MNIKCVYSTMPRCKHKMYCVFFFLFVFVFLVGFCKGGGSQLIANQTGSLLFQ